MRDRRRRQRGSPFPRATLGFPLRANAADGYARNAGNYWRAACDEHCCTRRTGQFRCGPVDWPPTPPLYDPAQTDRDGADSQKGTCGIRAEAESAEQPAWLPTFRGHSLREVGLCRSPSRVRSTAEDADSISNLGPASASRTRRGAQERHRMGEAPTIKRLRSLSASPPQIPTISLPSAITNWKI